MGETIRDIQTIRDRPDTLVLANKSRAVALPFALIGTKPLLRELLSDAALLPPVDVIQDSTGITLRADMPGVPKDKLELQVARHHAFRHRKPHRALDDQRVGLCRRERARRFASQPMVRYRTYETTLS